MKYANLYLLSVFMKVYSFGFHLLIHPKLSTTETAHNREVEGFFSHVFVSNIAVA